MRSITLAIGLAAVIGGGQAHAQWMQQDNPYQFEHPTSYGYQGQYGNSYGGGYGGQYGGGYGGQYGGGYGGGQYGGGQYGNPYGGGQYGNPYGGGQYGNPSSDPGAGLGSASMWSGAPSPYAGARGGAAGMPSSEGLFHMRQGGAGARKGPGAAAGGDVDLGSLLKGASLGASKGGVKDRIAGKRAAALGKPGPAKGKDASAKATGKDAAAAKTSGKDAKAAGKDGKAPGKSGDAKAKPEESEKNDPALDAIGAEEIPSRELPEEPASGGKDGQRELDTERVQTEFRQIDGNRDGTISYLEARDRNQIDLSTFRRFDADNSGLLDMQEFEAQMVLLAANRGQPVERGLKHRVDMFVGKSKQQLEEEKAKSQPGDDKEKLLDYYSKKIEGMQGGVLGGQHTTIPRPAGLPPRAPRLAYHSSY